MTLQHRGRVIYSERWNDEDEALTIPEEYLPTGVIGIILSDANGVPISKRLTFNSNRTEAVNTVFTTERDTHGTRERVNATVSVTDNENSPLRASFSISVIDNDIAHYDASVNILSYLLLTSDLRGHIEDPVYYFMSDNENAKKHLDLVMLTHGWTRFDTKRVYQEETIVTWDDFEASQVITGVLVGSLRRAADRRVTLLIPELGFADTAYTDNEGRFRFENFEFPEGTEFFIQGNRGTEIRIDEPTFPAVNSFFYPYKSKINDIPVFDAGQRERDDFRRYMVDDDIWSMYLDELVVTERRREAINPRRSFFSSDFHRQVDSQLLEVMSTAPNLFELLLRTVPGLEQQRCGRDNDWGLVFFRRPPRLAEDPFAPPSEPPPLPEPLILIDNTTVSSTSLHGFYSQNIESIEFCHFGLGFGIRGYNGVIIITTNDTPPPRAIPPNVTTIIPLGYQVTREFFAPAYTFPEQIASERPDSRTTIFWNPSVTTNENGSANIHFYTSDYVGNYIVIIEGITDEGGIVHTMKRMR